MDNDMPIRLQGSLNALMVGIPKEIQFDSDKNGELDRQLLISLDEAVEETIRPEYIAWLELQ